MTEDEFWTLIEGARRDGEGSLGRQVQLLRDYFWFNPSADVLLGFRDRWDEADERVFTWPIWDAACVLLGFVSDDFFADVRAWIISHGRAVVDRIIEDPDALVELAGDVSALENCDAEELGMLVMETWELEMGEDYLPSEVPRLGPTGVRIDLKDDAAVQQHFPRLAEVTGFSRSPK